MVQGQPYTSETVTYDAQNRLTGYTLSTGPDGGLQLPTRTARPRITYSGITGEPYTVYTITL